MAGTYRISSRATRDQVKEGVPPPEESVHGPPSSVIGSFRSDHGSKRSDVGPNRCVIGSKSSVIGETKWSPPLRKWGVAPRTVILRRCKPRSPWPGWMSVDLRNRSDPA